MSPHLVHRLAVAIAFALTPATVALAQSEPGPVLGGPASILVFPLYDSTEGTRTAITVTNASFENRVCGEFFQRGDVALRFVYMRGSDATPFVRFEFLGPGDTLSVTAAVHDSRGGKGWLWVEARSPENPNRPIDFDNLMGSAVISNWRHGEEWSYLAYGFRCYADGRIGATSCGHPYPSPPGDDFADMNGVEYDAFPADIIIDRFIGYGTPFETGGRPIAHRLVLLAPTPGAANATLVVTNNNRVSREAFRGFFVWDDATLAEITPHASATALRAGADTSELGGLPYGWIRIGTSEGGLLGLFQQQSGGPPHPGFLVSSGGSLPYQTVRGGVRLRRFE